MRIVKNNASSRIDWLDFRCPSPTLDTFITSRFCPRWAHNPRFGSCGRTNTIVVPSFRLRRKSQTCRTITHQSSAPRPSDEE